MAPPNHGQRERENPMHLRGATEGVSLIRPPTLAQQTRPYATWERCGPGTLQGEARVPPHFPFASPTRRPPRWRTTTRATGPDKRPCNVAPGRPSVLPGFRYLAVPVPEAAPVRRRAAAVIGTKSWQKSIYRGASLAGDRHGATRLVMTMGGATAGAGCAGPIRPRHTRRTNRTLCNVARWASRPHAAPPRFALFPLFALFAVPLQPTRTLQRRVTEEISTGPGQAAPGLSTRGERAPQ